jgi:hypothetical protein
MKFTILLSLAAIFSIFSLAANYEVSVTRKGSNVYKIDYANAYVHTRYCYEYVYYENSFLKMYGYSGEIIFLDSSAKCDVKGVYGKVDQPAGKYRVTINHEDDDWYEVFGQDMYIKTDGCLSLALGQEAILFIGSHGFGTMYVESDECMVEGIYARQRL